jgi:hypothetical protein
LPLPNGTSLAAVGAGGTGACPPSFLDARLPARDAKGSLLRPEASRNAARWQPGPYYLSAH